jgi:hypothetical protein
MQLAISLVTDLGLDMPPSTKISLPSGLIPDATTPAVSLEAIKEHTLREQRAVLGMFHVCSA